MFPGKKEGGVAPALYRHDQSLGVRREETDALMRLDLVGEHDLVTVRGTTDWTGEIIDVHLREETIKQFAEDDVT
ncbi:MAG TPA: hypothetical protein P5266_04645, partial [Candidatus Fermentibacter sp.]|nr:hypothetical protein [Candidatus Fermentibacter sp.]